MSLQGLLPLMQARPEFRRLVEQIEHGEAPPELHGVSESGKPYLLAALHTALHRPVLVVMQDEQRARDVAETLRVLTGRPEQALLFPDRDALPYERMIESAETMQLRLGALARLANGRGKQQVKDAPIIFTSARALTQPVIPPDELRAMLLEIAPGEEMDLELLLEQCYHLGYESVAEVEEPGQMTHRGGIVDLFPPTLVRPVRIEFFGDEIE